MKDILTISTSRGYKVQVVHDLPQDLSNYEMGAINGINVL